MKHAPLHPSLEPLLNAIMRYHFMTATQVHTRFYPKGSLTAAQTALKELTSAGLIQRRPFFDPKPDTPSFGKAPFLYHLADGGFQCLREMGYTLNGNYRPSDFAALTFYPIAHTLSVGDFLINAELFARDTTGVELACIRHERELQRRPFRYKDEARVLTYSPDALVDLRVRRADGLYREVIGLELDRGTEGKATWQAKLQVLLAWKQQAYTQEFGTNVLTVSVVVARGEERSETEHGRSHRMRNLIRWTEEVLARAGRRDLAEMFCFIAVDPAVAAPDELFCAPIWCQPFSSISVPLLESQKEASSA